MFSVAVVDHVMIAHSLRGAVFGPAQQLHGATYVVTTEYRCAELDADGLVLDIGLAHEVLANALAPLRYRNLDELDELRDHNTTTEFLAHYVHGRCASELRGRFRGSLRVVLKESHVAWASYEGDL